MSLDNIYIILTVLAVVILVLSAAFIALYFLNRTVDQSAKEPGVSTGPGDSDKGG